MEEQEIIRLLFARSETAVEALRNQFGPYCGAIALHIVGNYADAEECVSDTFFAVWNTIPPQKPERLRAYVGRIARNIALDRYDYLHAKKRNGEFDLILSELGECVQSREDTQQQVEDGLIRDSISAYLRGKKEADRNIFLRRYWYADTISEIAERFGAGESRIKSILYRMRRELRKHLQKEGIAL